MSQVSGECPQVRIQQVRRLDIGMAWSAPAQARGPLWPEKVELGAQEEMQPALRGVSQARARTSRLRQEPAQECEQWRHWTQPRQLRIKKAGRELGRPLRSFYNNLGKMKAASLGWQQ